MFCFRVVIRVTAVTSMGCTEPPLAAPNNVMEGCPERYVEAYNPSVSFLSLRVGGY